MDIPATSASAEPNSALFAGCANDCVALRLPQLWGRSCASRAATATFRGHWGGRGGGATWATKRCAPEPAGTAVLWRSLLYVVWSNLFLWKDRCHDVKKRAYWVLKNVSWQIKPNLFEGSHGSHPKSQHSKNIKSFEKFFLKPENSIFWKIRSV